MLLLVQFFANTSKGIFAESLLSGAGKTWGLTLIGISDIAVEGTDCEKLTGAQVNARIPTKSLEQIAQTWFVVFMGTRMSHAHSARVKAINNDTYS